MSRLTGFFHQVNYQERNPYLKVELMKGRAVIRLLAWLVITSFGAVASAAVVGDLKTGSAGTMTVTLSSVSFNPDPSSTPPGPPWNAEVATATSLTFAGCASGVLGSAGCL